MLTWRAFRDVEPDLADQGAALLYDVGVGLAYLATVRADGGPRVHPMCPLVTDRGLFAFIVPSPKQGDLRRDGRFAQHSFPMADNEDAFYVSGRAIEVHDGSLRAVLSEQFVAERSRFDVAAPGDDHALFELVVDRAMLTTTDGHGDPAPRHTIWHAP